MPDTAAPIPASPNFEKLKAKLRELFEWDKADLATGELNLDDLPAESVVRFKLVEGDTEKDNRKPDGKTTRAFALKATKGHNDEHHRTVDRSLVAAIERLEHSAGLLRLNLNEAAALEDFFLSSLRLWSRR